MIRPVADILYGPPGVGKDMQADLLASFYWQFSTGKMFRDLPAQKNEDAATIKEGGLAKDDSTFMHLDREFAKYCEHRKITEFDTKGLLLNGIPRKLSQIEGVLERFDVRRLILLGGVSDYDLFDRLWKREKEKKNTRGQNPGDIWKRLVLYKQHEAPVPEALEKRGVKIYPIDASSSPEIIQRKIREALGIEQLISDVSL